MQRLATLLFAVLAALQTIRAAERPNIVLILVDDMGYGDPRCFNPDSKIATPNLDRLAREGMRFTDAHAPGAVCHPSRYGLLTGSYPFRTDVSLWPKQPLIKEGQMTIASLLKSAGYHTAMVGKWHLGFEERGYDQPLRGGPVDRGFDRFFGFRASTDIPPYFHLVGDRALVAPTATIAESASHPGLGWSPVQGEYWKGGGIAPDLELKDVLPRFADEAVRVIRTQQREHPGKPFFLYFAPTAPHTPWLPAPEYQGRSAAGRYGDFAIMVDALIGRVLGELDTAGLSENTLVIFTSDNGPVWYPDDTKRTGHDSTAGFRGMKGSNWEAGHRMPFIARWPARIKAGTTSSQLICFTDLLATFAAITGRELPSGAGPDSISFLPALLGRPAPREHTRSTLVVGQSLRSGPWKWIEGRERLLWFKSDAGTYPAKNDAPGQLYNLADDPRETKNLRTVHPEIAARLADDLRAIQRGTRTRL